jgi:zinc transporter, ZIP family
VIRHRGYQGPVSANLLHAVLLTFLAGASAFAGALLGRMDESAGGVLSDEARNFIIAFGGGALIGAVGLVLVPHGLHALSLGAGALTFIAGGVAFLLTDRSLQRAGTPASQLVALNLDFIPEAIVVGAVIANNLSLAIFLSVIMVAQNLPEGFNAYREVRKSHASFFRRHILQLMSLCMVIGPLTFELRSAGLGSIMMFCAGGILYLVFEDIAPEAHRRGDWGPALGAVFGFTVALIGFGLTG